MNRFRPLVLATVAVAALLIAVPAHAHRGAGTPPSPAVVAVADPIVAAPAPATVASPIIRAAPVRLMWLAGPERLALPWTLLAALAGVAALAARRRPRAVVAVTLAALVGVLAFESGVHSVHHLGEPSHASACAVASTSLNLTGLEVEPVVLLDAPGPLGPAVALVTPLDARALPGSPHEGRAPPRSS